MIICLSLYLFIILSLLRNYLTYSQIEGEIILKWYIIFNHILKLFVIIKVGEIVSPSFLWLNPYVDNNKELSKY